MPEGFADGTDDDTQLSESEVEAYITDGAIDLASGSTIGRSSPPAGSVMGDRIYINTRYNESYGYTHSVSCDGSDLPWEVAVSTPPPPVTI